MNVSDFGRNLKNKIMNKKVSVVFLCPVNLFSEYDEFITSLESKKPFSVYQLHCWELNFYVIFFNFQQKIKINMFLNFDFTWSSLDQLHLCRPQILIFSYNQYKQNEVLGILAKQKHVPNILILLSDEWGKENQLHAQTTHIPLILRQHYHPHYHFPFNVNFLPVGFMQGMFGKNLRFLPSVFLLSDKKSSSFIPLPPSNCSVRKHFWTFVGNIGTGLKSKCRMDMKQSLDKHQLRFSRKNCQLSSQ